jgi:hypothetical protein
MKTSPKEEEEETRDRLMTLTGKDLEPTHLMEEDLETFSETTEEGN